MNTVTQGKYTTPLQVPSRFLSSIIPSTWVERIYDYKGYYFIYVTGEKVTDDYWNQLQDKFRTEFGDNLQHIYEHPSAGIAFEVYLKKGE